MLKVNAYTGGINVPSARYRIRQLIPNLAQYDINVKEFISKAGVYPPHEIYKRPYWALSNLTENMLKILTQPVADLSFIQREMFTMHHTFESMLRGPRVFDVDDAIFIHKEGIFAKTLARKMQKIICGNSFLANRFSEWNSNVEIIPTAVDIARYDIRKNDKVESGRHIVIIWSGSSSGYRFVYNIERALFHVLEKNKNAKLRLISDRPPAFQILRDEHFEYVKWSPEIEFSSIVNGDIGIMPINDDDLSRGKCSFKMLTYMAARLPVVASPYGMNKDVLEMGQFGIGAITGSEWVDALDVLIRSEDHRVKYGNLGHDVVKRNFDVHIIAGKLAKSLKNI